MLSRWLFASALAASVGACTPDIASGAYMCGPNSSCPDGQVCSGLDYTCVLAGLAEPFACEPDLATEPDDTMGDAHVLANLDCVSAPFVVDSCMPEADGADWVRFTAPSVCAQVSVEARVTFPLAFQQLGLELWDVSANQQVATDATCGSGEAGEELRCLTAALTPGSSYAIQVRPTGDGDCDGECAFNKYTLRVQLH